MSRFPILTKRPNVPTHSQVACRSSPARLFKMTSTPRLYLALWMARAKEEFRLLNMWVSGMLNLPARSLLFSSGPTVAKISAPHCLATCLVVCLIESGIFWTHCLELRIRVLNEPKPHTMTRSPGTTFARPCRLDAQFLRTRRPGSSLPPRPYTVGGWLAGARCN